MENYYLIKVSEKLSSYPSKIQVFKSKFEREIGDTITFEGQRWFVMSEPYECKAEANQFLKRFVNRLVKEGIWEGQKTSVAKF